MPMTDPLPVRSACDQWAGTYDTDVNATRDLDAALLRATPLPLDGAAVVEFGGGTGKNTLHLASLARQVIGLDVSDAMLAVARQRVTTPHVRFVTHDVTRPWPVPDHRADVVVGNLVLEHVSDLAPVFTAARRALRTSGLMVLCELHPYRQWRGAGARFADGAGERRVEAYVHATADYVTAGLAAGFRLTSMREVSDATATPGEPSPLPRPCPVRCS